MSSKSENNKTYIVKANEELEFELTAADLKNADIQQFKDGKYHLILEGKSLHYEVEWVDLNEKTVHLKSNGKVYRISIRDELDVLIESMGLETEEGALESTVNAPMPGLVLEVFVSPGDEVGEGDQLLILEAMKMENVIKSPGAGQIKKVEVGKGESVEKGAVLIEFE